MSYPYCKVRDVNPTAAQIVKFIRRFSKKTGYPPTYQEIADSIGVTRPAVYYHVLRLEEDGVLTFEAGKPRTLRVR